jgi:hypothetical protein
MRGAILNATSRAEKPAAPDIPADSNNAARPVDGSRARRRKPAPASARFSSTSGTTSAMVATATASSQRRGSSANAAARFSMRPCFTSA